MIVQYGHSTVEIDGVGGGHYATSGSTCGRGSGGGGGVLRGSTGRGGTGGRCGLSRAGCNKQHCNNREDKEYL